MSNLIVLYHSKSHSIPIIPSAPNSVNILSRDCNDKMFDIALEDPKMQMGNFTFQQFWTVVSTTALFSYDNLEAIAHSIA